jgi:tRNA pseudouridine55 synthase
MELTIMDGILIIDKPQWLTSHDVVVKLRKKLGQQKIGHAGTLDPLATGILIVVIGKATKLVPQLINHDKAYDVSMTLGLKTDSGDITGKILKKEEIHYMETARLKEAFNKFIGEIDQIPPMISAKKHKGRPLYKYARQGKVIPRAPKKINIYAIKMGKVSFPEVSFTVDCSKGTYIRTLCEDIGDILGIGACASKIRRTKSGQFIIDQAISLDTLLSLSTEEIKKHLISPYSEP